MHIVTRVHEIVFTEEEKKTITFFVETSLRFVIFKGFL